MSKTLNKGTLSLRFMQNAQRAKDPSEVVPAQATLPDDAEWHVPQTVKDTWTSADAAATNPNSAAAVSEPSYLPFLFHAEDKVSPFKGRRSFVHGKEVIPQPEPVRSSSDPPHPATTDSVSGGTSAGRGPRDGALINPKKEKKPVSISGFKSSVSATSSASRLPGKKPVLPASSLIYRDADVGVDLGSTRRAASYGAGFIKPADVDAPPPLPQPPNKPVVEQKKRMVDPSDSSLRPIVVPEDSPRKKRKR